MIRLEQREGGRGFFGPRGFMTTPGTYNVTLTKVVDGVVTVLAGPQDFKVVPLYEKGALEGASFEEIRMITAQVQSLQQEITATSIVLEKSLKKIGAMRVAVTRVNQESNELVLRIHAAKQKLLALSAQLNGSEAKREVGERSNPTPSSRMFVGLRGLRSSYGPTLMHKESIELSKKQLAGIKADLMDMTESILPDIEDSLKKAGAPLIEGQSISEN